MSDLAAEVLVQLQRLQLDDDMQRPLFLRHTSRYSNEPRKLSVRHGAGRRWYVLDVEGQELLFEAQREVTAATAFLRACRSHESPVTHRCTDVGFRFELFHEGKSKKVMEFEVRVPLRDLECC